MRVSELEKGQGEIVHMGRAGTPFLRGERVMRSSWPLEEEQRNSIALAGHIRGEGLRLKTPRHIEETKGKSGGEAGRRMKGR